MFNSLCKQLNAKKNGKKGFTLVELIVVLVILAILLAILVPSLTKWIDKAKEKQVLLPARTVYLACQTVTSEDYALATPLICGKGEQTFASAAATGVGKAVVDLANTGTIYSVKFTADANGNITAFSYTEGDKMVSLDQVNKALAVAPTATPSTPGQS